MMTDAKLALLVFGLLAVYCLLVLIKPQGLCLRCGGTRRSKRHLFWGPVGKCSRCKGHKIQRYPGARTIHRFFWLAIGNRLMTRRRESED